MDPFASLTAEYEAYVAAAGLPAMSADELVLEDEPSAEQKRWLSGFIMRWEGAEAIVREFWPAGFEVGATGVGADTAWIRPVGDRPGALVSIANGQSPCAVSTDVPVRIDLLVAGGIVATVRLEKDWMPEEAIEAARRLASDHARDAGEDHAD